MTLHLQSSAFGNGGTIPRIHTCDGKDISPHLTWRDVPSNARSLVLIVDDPDAPDPAAPQRTWVHWVLYDIPPEAAGLSQGVTTQDLPAGTREGLNDWKRTGYGGPCPPIGRHRYVHKLYALDTLLGTVQDKADKAQLEKAMHDHVIAQAELIGLYQRS